jgi:tagatose kinase
MIGRVGDDDFGWLNIERLRADGVDVSAIGVDPEMPTGTAFVTYEEGGDRHFVFNIRHSASGHLTMTEEADRLLSRCGHFHVMGSSLFSPVLRTAMRGAIERVKTSGGRISFDPNVRKELTKNSDLAAFFDFVLERCDLLLPSEAELLLLTGAATETEAIEALLGRGIGAIVVKRGAHGASHYDRAGAVHAFGPVVEEVDPTGAGDCFGATFVVCRLRGMTIEQCLRYGNASGAYAVTIKGPMEGAASFAELDAWLDGRQP